MDERQTQIREGAGLEDSRLNTELIDWLKKWSTPILVVVAVIALLYALNQRMEESRLARVDNAFIELDAASQGPVDSSPDSLARVAEDFSGVKVAVPELARLRAADVYLISVVRGLDVGARPGPDGSLEDESDLLDETERESYLAQAQRLYDMVWQSSKDKPSKAIHAIPALYGLAAVAECRRDFGAAKQFYEQIKTTAAASGYEAHIHVVDERIASLDTLGELPTLPKEADLPEPPQPETPEIELPEITVPPADGPGEAGPPAPGDDDAPADDLPQPTDDEDQPLDEGETPSDDEGPADEGG